MQRSPRLLMSMTGLVALTGLGALAALFTAPFADPPAVASIIQPSATSISAAMAAGRSGADSATGPERLAASPARDARPMIALVSGTAAPSELPEAEVLEPDDPRWAKTGMEAVDPDPSAASPMPPALADASEETTTSLQPVEPGELPGSNTAVAPVALEASPLQDQAASDDEAQPPDDTQTAAIPPAEPVIEAAKPKPKERPTAAAATSGAPPSSNVAVTSAVKMRARAAKGAAVVTVVPDNATVGLVRCQAWCEVVYKGRRGFIYKSFIASGQKPSQTATTEPSKPKIVPPTRIDTHNMGR